MKKFVLFLFLPTMIVLDCNAADRDASSAQSNSAQINDKDNVYNTAIQSGQLPSSDTFLFVAKTDKVGKNSPGISIVHQVIQKEDHEGYEIYSVLTQSNSPAVDPAVEELIREHESNIMQHVIVFLDSINPALVREFLTAKQLIESTVTEKQEHKANNAHK